MSILFQNIKSPDTNKIQANITDNNQANINIIDNNILWVDFEDLFLEGFEDLLLEGLCNNEDVDFLSGLIGINDTHAFIDRVEEVDSSDNFYIEELNNYSYNQETISSFFFECLNPDACNFENADSVFGLLQILKESQNNDLKNDLIGYFNQEFNLIYNFLKNFSICVKFDQVDHDFYFKSMHDFCVNFCKFANDIYLIHSNYNIEVSCRFFFQFLALYSVMKDKGVFTVEDCEMNGFVNLHNDDIAFVFFKRFWARIIGEEINNSFIFSIPISSVSNNFLINAFKNLSYLVFVCKNFNKNFNNDINNNTNFYINNFISSRPYSLNLKVYNMVSIEYSSLFLSSFAQLLSGFKSNKTSFLVSFLADVSVYSELLDDNLDEIAIIKFYDVFGSFYYFLYGIYHVYLVKKLFPNFLKLYNLFRMIANNPYSISLFFTDEFKNFFLFWEKAFLIAENFDEFKDHFLTNCVQFS